LLAEAGELVFQVEDVALEGGDFVFEGGESLDVGWVADVRWRGVRRRSGVLRVDFGCVRWRTAGGGVRVGG